jgi:hypothetical protein
MMTQLERSDGWALLEDLRGKMVVTHLALSEARPGEFWRAAELMSGSPIS